MSAQKPVSLPPAEPNPDEARRRFGDAVTEGIRRHKGKAASPERMTLADLELAPRA